MLIDHSPGSAQQVHKLGWEKVCRTRGRGLHDRPLHRRCAARCGKERCVAHASHTRRADGRGLHR